jgi:hypothetical protein
MARGGSHHGAETRLRASRRMRPKGDLLGRLRAVKIVGPRDGLTPLQRILLLQLLIHHGNGYHLSFL